MDRWQKKEKKLNRKESLGAAGFQSPPYVGPVWIKENPSIMPMHAKAPALSLKMRRFPKACKNSAL
jgi:hypothetical protein